MTPTSDHLDLDLPAVPGSAARAREAVLGLLRDDRLDPHAVALIVAEAVGNAVLHAYRDRDCPGRVRVVADVGPDGLELVVADDGVGLSPRDDSPGAGVGLQLIERLADRVDVAAGRGTRLAVHVRPRTDAAPDRWHAASPSRPTVRVADPPQA